MSANTWAHVVVRAAVRPLVRTPVTPDHLTALRLITGLASSLLLASGAAVWSDIAAGVFVISFFLDRADGELARQSGKSSARGHRFDLLADFASNISIFIGMGLGLRSTEFGLSAAGLGLVAGLSIVAIFFIISRIEQIDGATAAAFPTAGGLDPDDAMLIVPVAVWLGGEAFILAAAAIGAPVFLIWTCVRFRKYLAQLFTMAPARRPSINQ